MECFQHVEVPFVRGDLGFHRVALHEPVQGAAADRGSAAAGECTASWPLREFTLALSALASSGWRGYSRCHGDRVSEILADQGC